MSNNNNNNNGLVIYRIANVEVSKHVYDTYKDEVTKYKDEVTKLRVEDEVEDSIFRKAERLINGDRKGDYGDARSSFVRVAKVWSAILDMDVSPEQVGLCMAGFKLIREVYKHKEDNLVDAIGYLGLVDLLACGDGDVEGKC